MDSAPPERAAAPPSTPSSTAAASPPSSSRKRAAVALTPKGAPTLAAPSSNNSGTPGSPSSARPGTRQHQHQHQQWPSTRSDATGFFVCKRCKQLVTLHPSLVGLAEADARAVFGSAQPDDLSRRRNSGSAGPSPPPDFPGSSSVPRVPQPGAQGPGRPLGDERGAGAPHDYYVVLPNHLGTAPAAAPAKGAEQFPAPSLLDTGEDKPARSSLSYRLKVTDRLLASASATEVQHPMCEECAETLLQIMNERVEEMSEEKDAYEAFLAEHAGDAPTEEDERQLEREIVELEAKEKDAIRAIKDIERQRSQLQEEMRLLAREEEELDQLTDKYWAEHSDFELQLQRFRDERDGVNLKYDHDARLLGKLQRTNVYNDAFRIGHDGHFATINGLRLGRLPGQNVDWNEINAAWGQTLLLLYTIAGRLGFQFKNYRLVPLGSFSRIERTDDDKAVYELYGSGDLHIGRLFLNRRFDNAMVAFLNCLKQLGDYAEEADSSAKLPYSINKERIGDVSIRLQFNNDEAWTKALKYTLTNTKWLLAFASNRPAMTISVALPEDAHI